MVTCTSDNGKERSGTAGAVSFFLTKTEAPSLYMKGTGLKEKERETDEGSGMMEMSTQGSS